MDTLTLNQRRARDVVVLDLAGRITLGNLDRPLPNALQRLVAEGERSVILDLSKVTYMDSTGLGELVAGYSTLKRNGGRMVLLKLSDRIMDLMTVTKLYTVFDIYDDEAQALESFETPAPIAATTPVVNAATSRLS